MILISMQDMLSKQWMPWRLGGTTCSASNHYQLPQPQHHSFSSPPTSCSQVSRASRTPTVIEEDEEVLYDDEDSDDEMYDDDDELAASSDHDNDVDELDANEDGDFFVDIED